MKFKKNQKRFSGRRGLVIQGSQPFTSKVNHGKTNRGLFSLKNTLKEIGEVN